LKGVNFGWKLFVQMADVTSQLGKVEISDSKATDRIININVGILGHIDSGKTSLGNEMSVFKLMYAAKALSTLPSTASFDKSPQSKERGITLDLGFSAFIVDKPSHLGKIQI
jgi:selenocysteine-specific elongation factor